MRLRSASSNLLRHTRPGGRVSRHSPVRASRPAPARAAVTMLLAAAAAAGPLRAAGPVPTGARPPAGALPGPAAAAPLPQERSWRLASFHADVEVFKSGEIVVTETLRPRFDGEYNGIFRTIPVEYRTPAGFRYRLGLDVEAVTDEAGNELRYERSRDGDYVKVKIWVPGAVDATKTVLLRYRVHNGLRFFEADEGRDGIETAYDELYWNVTGTEWPVPIDEASATIRLPVEVTGIRAHAFTGAYGSAAQDAEVTIDGPRVAAATTRPLGFREGLTVGVAWDTGVVERPTAVDKAGALLAANWILFLPFLAFFLMYRRWRERGRDPQMGSIEPRYEPPGSLTPAEVGVIVDNSPDMRDITATLVDLAVRGYVKIEEIEHSKLFGLMSDKDYAFHRVRPSSEWAGLQPHELALLRAVFGGRETVELSDLKNKFYKDLPDLKSGLMDTLVTHQIYDRRPDKVAGMYVGVGIAIGVFLIVLGLTVGRFFHLAPVAVVIAGVASALVVIGFGVVMPARSRHGVDVLRQVKGFEEFLERVESDRFKRMITGPEMFEKFLPFAMALGVESQWAAAFADMYREPPSWYVGSNLRGFNTGVLVSDLSHMSSRTQTVMQSAPRSSGGSSFGGGGGGGFSGGGFGGGGGGAF